MVFYTLYIIIYTVSRYFTMTTGKTINCDDDSDDYRPYMEVDDKYDPWYRRR